MADLSQSLLCGRSKPPPARSPCHQSGRSGSAAAPPAPAMHAVQGKDRSSPSDKPCPAPTASAQVATSKEVSECLSSWLTYLQMLNGLCGAGSRLAHCLGALVQDTASPCHAVAAQCQAAWEELVRATAAASSAVRAQVLSSLQEVAAPAEGDPDARRTLEHNQPDDVHQPAAAVLWCVLRVPGRGGGRPRLRGRPAAAVPPAPPAAPPRPPAPLVRGRGRRGPRRAGRLRGPALVHAMGELAAGGAPRPPQPLRQAGRARGGAARQEPLRHPRLGVALVSSQSGAVARGDTFSVLQAGTDQLHSALSPQPAPPRSDADQLPLRRALARLERRAGQRRPLPRLRGCAPGQRLPPHPALQLARLRGPPARTGPSLERSCLAVCLQEVRAHLYSMWSGNDLTFTKLAESSEPGEAPPPAGDDSAPHTFYGSSKRVRGGSLPRASVGRRCPDCCVCLWLSRQYSLSNKGIFL
ncbi:uncharacterized protein LOC134540812 isoform X5 [Bacillus rossius redtenbacheri]|uniref:uncharacterized protein LOC134540812 isoform X5 n=1 Tax=Bacillus rossius redtenbacheri TaxID=93214 RepID=UPI002FDDAC8F